MKEWLQVLYAGNVAHLLGSVELTRLGIRLRLIGFSSGTKLSVHKRQGTNDTISTLILGKLIQYCTRIPTLSFVCWSDLIWASLNSKAKDKAVN
jgi:hypothetical protein